VHPNLAWVTCQRSATPLIVSVSVAAIKYLPEGTAEQAASVWAGPPYSLCIIHKHSRFAL